MADEKENKDESKFGEDLTKNIEDLTHIKEAPNRDLGFSGEKAENVHTEGDPSSAVVAGEGKGLTSDEIKNDAASVQDTIAKADENSDPTDWKAKYDALQKQFGDLQHKYSVRFSGIDRPEAVPSDLLKNEMSAATKMNSGNPDDFASLFEDSGSKNTLERMKDGDYRNDPRATTRFQTNTQSTAPTYYANQTPPENAAPDLNSKDYMTRDAGSTAGTPDETSFDDLFEDTKKKGISW